MAEDIVKKPMCRRCSSAQKKTHFMIKSIFFFTLWNSWIIKKFKQIPLWKLL